MLLSIDPGVHDVGMAVWSDDGLHWAGFVQQPSGVNKDPRNIVSAVEHKLSALRLDWVLFDLVIEKPQVYVRTRSKGDPNDLIDLALVVGAFFQRASGKVTTVLPAAWKGQVPKPIMGARILAKLNDEERARIEAGPLKKMHNAIDAIGIGLHYLKRL